MTQKSHPIGLRLTISTFWRSPASAITFHPTYDFRFFFERWILGFFENNYLLLHQVQFLGRTRFTEYVSIFFFSSLLLKKFKRAAARNHLFFQSRILAIRHRTDVKVFSQYISQRFRQLYQLSRLCLLQQRDNLPQYIKYRWAFSIFPRICSHWRGIFFPFKRKSSKKLVARAGSQFFTAKTEIVRQVTLKQIYLLRLKAFLESAIGYVEHRRVILFLTNLLRDEWSIGSRDLVTLLYKELQGTPKRVQSSVRVTRTFCDLTVLSVLLANPNMLLQYFYYQLMFLRKHESGLLSHTSSFFFLTRLCESLVYTFGVLSGLLVLIRGKFDGSARSRHRRFATGTVYSPQKLNLTLAYGLRAIPLYSGILSVRLWFLY